MAGRTIDLPPPAIVQTSRKSRCREQSSGHGKIFRTIKRIVEMTRCEGCKVSYDEDYRYCLNCGVPIGPEGEFPTIKMNSKSSNPKISTGSMSKSSNVINFDRSSNQGIVANRLTVRTGSVKFNPPPGIIASDANMRGYAKYLIDRYHEFRKSDATIGKMKFVPVYTAIRREFKCKWDDVPMDRFADLVQFLQTRIDKTVTGQSLCKKGQWRYETYSEWLNTR